MRYKYITAISIFLALLVSGGLILMSCDDAGKASNHTAEQHTEIGEHENQDGEAPHKDDLGEEAHAEAEHERKMAFDLHLEHPEDEGDDHGDSEESDIIEMTGAQLEEIGLVIATARRGDIQYTLSFFGEVRLNEDRVVHLVPLVSGIVRSVSASLGENVPEGRELAKIDSPELAELKADYLEKFRNLDLTRFTFERKEYLWQEKIAGEADRLEAQAAFQNAETLLLAAKRRLMALGYSEQQVLNIPEAGDDNFGRYTITTPISGTIIAKHITRGEKIDGEELFVIADLSEVWVDLHIPAQNLRQVAKGLGVEITSAEGRREHGELILVGPVINEESRTALGRVTLKNPEAYWKPGQFVTGEILNRTTSTVVVVPSNAVQNIDGENIIFVPEGDGFKPVEVTLGKSTRDKTQIIAGLKTGDRYVARGAFSLKAIKATSGAGSHAGHGH